jgi:hypothetical protein
MSNKITLLHCISEEERKKKSSGRSVMIFIQCYAIFLLSGNSELGITTKKSCYVEEKKQERKRINILRLSGHALLH